MRYFTPRPFRRPIEPPGNAPCPREVLRLRWTRAGAFLLAAAAAVFSATPVLSRLEVIGSGQGVALTLGADAAFGITISEKRPEKSATAVLSIKCAGVIYGLDEYQFSAFPPGAPLRQITAEERKETGSVELLVKTSVPVDKNIRFKQKDNRWIILLTSAKVSDFAWSAQSGRKNNSAPPSRENREAVKNAVAPVRESREAVTNAPTPVRESREAVKAGPVRPPQPSAPPVLVDITIMRRDGVEKVVFAFDAATEMIVKSMPDAIIALFVNAKNGLARETFPSDTDGLVRSVELKRMVRGTPQGLGATILIKRDGDARPLIQTFPDKLVIYGSCDAKECLSFRSAKSGSAVSHAFLSPQPFPVDLKKIERRALSDATIDVARAGTFSIAQPPPTAPQPPAAPVPPPTVRVVVVKDNAALHSRPSTTPESAVTGRLALGAVATRIENKGGWIRVEADTMRGWMLGSQAVDSAKAPKSLWDRIAAAKTAAARREEKLREAERIQQEKKIRDEQLAEAKRKALEEEKRKKAELAAAKAAAPKAPATGAVKPLPNEKPVAAAAAKPLPNEKSLADASPAPGVKPGAATVPSTPAGKPAMAAGQSAPIEKIAAGPAPDEAKPRPEGGQIAPAPLQVAATVPAPQEKPAPDMIEYKMFGRDPFLPLLQEDDGPLPAVEHLQMVGILYDNAARIALFEDVSEQSKAFALRENDPVKNGYLLRIKPDEAIFMLSEFGVSRTYAMKMMKEKKAELVGRRARPGFPQQPDKGAQNNAPVEGGDN